MTRRMEQNRSPGWKLSRAAQWAAIQAYAFATPPVKVRAVLWQTNTVQGEHFTKSLDFVLKDIAKETKFSLTELLAAQLFPAGAPVAAPVAVGNDRKLPQTIHIECAQYILIWLVQVLSARSLSVSR